MHGGSPPRLDRHDAGGGADGRRDAADETAAAAGHEHGVDLRRLLLKLEPDGALPGYHVRCVVGVHDQAAGLLGAALAGRKGLGVGPSDQRHVPAERADPLHLHHRCGLGHEQLRPQPQPARHVRDGEGVVAPGGRHEQRGGAGERSTCVNAPRGLKDPVCCSSSSLSTTGPTASVPASTTATGVRRTCPRNSRAACSTSSLLTVGLPGTTTT